MTDHDDEWRQHYGMKALFAEHAAIALQVAELDTLSDEQLCDLLDRVDNGLRLLVGARPLWDRLRSDVRLARPPEPPDSIFVEGLANLLERAGWPHATARRELESIFDGLNPTRRPRYASTGSVLVWQLRPSVAATSAMVTQTYEEFRHSLQGPYEFFPALAELRVRARQVVRRGAIVTGALLATVGGYVTVNDAIGYLQQQVPALIRLVEPALHHPVTFVPDEPSPPTASAAAPSAVSPDSTIDLRDVPPRDGRKLVPGGMDDDSVERLMREGGGSFSSGPTSDRASAEASPNREDASDADSRN